jgi:two-component sensor histidine kinase
LPANRRRDLTGTENLSSLSARLIALLTVALLPLGLIAVYQTQRVVSEAEDLSKREMLARTLEVARAQVELIIEAEGAAKALGATVAEIGSDSPQCNRVMRAFMDRSPRFVFAGFIETEGLMRCVSMGEPFDFSGFETWTRFVNDPRPTVVINREGTSSGVSVLVVNTPAFSSDGRRLLGATSISIPHSLLDTLVSAELQDVDVAITDGAGKILSYSNDRLESRLMNASNFVPADLNVPKDGSVVSIDPNTSLSVVPIEPFDIYVVGTWSNGSNPLSVSFFGTAAPLFPIAMWLASLFVAMFAVQGLVLRHLKKLRRGMRRVSLENADASFVQLEGAPREISEIGDSYNALLRRVSNDAEILSEAAEEKELLLKEIHHRVKNNLQLIASILNMQLRQITSPDAQSVLKRVQQRVMSLAAIHKLLYTDTKIELVRADLLLSEIINNSVKMANSGKNNPETSVSLDPVELHPDRAVPLALLVTEAVTNAMKYVGSSDGVPGQITVKLTEGSDDKISLQVRNTLGDGETSQSMEDGTGLGSKLIAAFVMQLDGESRLERYKETYTIHVDFPRDTALPLVNEDSVT